MKTHFLALLVFATLLLAASPCAAHCDTRDGPVVLAAQRALATGNVKLVLIWVQPQDDALIRTAFKKTMDLRKASPAAQKAMDEYFFETLVRVHRAGEGVAYTGLKDAAQVEVPFAESDRAIDSGSLTAVTTFLDQQIHQQATEKFQAALAKQHYDPNDVAAGRAYVASYVVFLHYVEGIYDAAGPGGASHAQTAAAHRTAPAGVAAAHHAAGSAPGTTAGMDHHSLDAAGTTAGMDHPHDAAGASTNHTTNYLIAGAALLIILVQVGLSRRKKLLPA